MIDYPISPINLGGFRILSFALDFNETSVAIEANQDRSFTVEFGVGTSFSRKDDGLSRCTCTLALQCDIAKAAEDESEGTHLGKINARLMGFATGRFAPEESDEAICDTLEANAASFLYGKARTYIELMTAYCPGGSISLPAIMPTPKEA